MGGVRAAVVGTGLIGGSILLRLHGAGVDVTGWDPDPATRQEGRNRGVPFADEFADALADRDLVILCGPLPSLPETLRQVAEQTGPECVITDVGSTKASLAGFAAAQGLTDRFVPGHPMAGADRAGLVSASPTLFDGAAWVLCPTPGAGLVPFRRLTGLLAEIFAARVVPMSPTVHDAVVALSSHVPHLLAGSLAGAVGRSGSRDAVLALAAGSFRDGTRVAGTPARRTAAMLLDNADAVLRELAGVRALLDELAAALEAGDGEGLTGLLGRGQATRQALAHRPTTGTEQRFPAEGPGTEEIAFLLELGAAGGHLGGCRSTGAEVVYAVHRPAAEPGGADAPPLG